jgi:hypothetical protein
MNPGEVVLGSVVGIIIVCLVTMCVCFTRIAYIEKKKYEKDKKKFMVDIRSIPTADIITNPVHYDNSPV